MAPSLELATFTRTSALLALNSGAHRIELCAQKHHDGLTPPIQDYLSISSALSQDLQRSDGFPAPEDDDNRLPASGKINLMIRPLDNGDPSEDFRVQFDVFEKMKEEIRMFKGLGARGFVFGILKDEYDDEGKGSLIIDQERCRELLKISREGNDGEKVRCTFHRAFDRIEKERMGEQLEVLINLSFTSLLTSGGSPTSVQGKTQIRKLVEQAAGRIEIIVGGGVRSHNLKELIDETGAQWFHSSAVTGEGDEVDGEEVRKLRAIMYTQGADPVGNLQ